MLEPLLGSHADHLFSMLSDPRVRTWIPAPKATSVDELRDRWTARESRCDANGLEAQLAWAVRREADGAYVGKIDANVSGIKWATNVGFILGYDHWGGGYATEAVKAVVEHLFGVGINGAHAYVMPENKDSIRVLERAGFEADGVLLGELKFTRRASPNVVMTR